MPGAHALRTNADDGDDDTDYESLTMGASSSGAPALAAGKASGGAMRCTQREYSAIRFEVSCYRPANLVQIVSDPPLVSLCGELHLRGELL